MIRLLLPVSLLLAATAVQPADMGKRSRHLHDFYCRSCHSSTIYLLEERKVASREALIERVTAYGDSGKVSLTQDELRGIADYLGRAYYDF